MPKSNSHKSNNRLSRRSIKVLFSLCSIVFNPSKVEYSLSRSYFFSPNRFDLGKVDCSTVVISVVVESSWCSSNNTSKRIMSICASGRGFTVWYKFTRIDDNLSMWHLIMHTDYIQEMLLCLFSLIQLLLGKEKGYGMYMAMGRYFTEFTLCVILFTEERTTLEFFEFIIYTEIFKWPIHEHSRLIHVLLIYMAPSSKGTYYIIKWV